MNKYDGGGELLSPYFISKLKTFNKKFNNCFEWCAGPGYIGRDILNNSLCNNLILADINNKSLSYGRNKFPKSPKISYYESDNLKSIPSSLHRKIDLVVANPPNYYNIQSRHHIGKTVLKDLRPNDREWKIHKDFYYSIKPFLTKDAILLIHEIGVFEKEIYIQSTFTPYDIRINPPIMDFYDMTKLNNLTISEIAQTSPSFYGYLLTILNN